jgi:hypothetical protein
MAALIRRQLPKRSVNTFLHWWTVRTVDLFLGMMGAMATALLLALLARDAIGMPLA